MENAWNVIWWEGGKKLTKVIEGDSPRPAVDFGKSLKERGILVVEVVSRRKAFAIPKSKRVAPGSGLLWCPYCIKWREFRFFSVKRKVLNGLPGTPALRCPICTISINNPYVRQYNSNNPMLYHEQARVVSEKAIKRRIRRGRR